MSFSRRYCAIDNVVHVVQKELKRSGLDIGLQTYSLQSLLNIDRLLVFKDRYLAHPQEKATADHEMEQKLDHVYAVVTSPEFYTNVTRRCKDVCMNDMENPMFEQQASFKVVP